MIGYSVNTSTGALSGATNSAVASAPNHVAATQATNPLVYAACSGGTVDYIAVASFGGAATQVAAGTTPLSMTVNKTETKAFVSNSGAGTVSIYSMSNGTLSLAGTVTACTTPGQLTINAAGYAYLVCRGDNKVNAYSLGTDTLSLVGSYTTGTTPASVAGY